MKLLKIHVGPGEEVMEVLTRRLRDGGVRQGAIVSVIGAVDECRISNMPVNDAGRDVMTDYSRPFELSGTGEVEDGKPHIHCVLGTEGNETYSALRGSRETVSGRMRKATGAGCSP